MNNDQLWQAALGEIELSLSKANFTTWFKSTFISSFEDDKVIVCVPNTFTKAWLEKKYHNEIASALKNVSNKPIKEVFYKVETKKLAKMEDGNIGNISQGQEIFYVDCEINLIEDIINDYLNGLDQVCFIKNVSYIDGIILKASKTNSAKPD